MFHGFYIPNLSVFLLVFRIEKKSVVINHRKKAVDIYKVHRSEIGI